MDTNHKNLDLDLIPENARSLFQIVKDLEIKFGYERSFKLLENTLLSNRHLISLGNLSPRYNHKEKIIEICQQLNIPHNLLDSAKSALDNTNLIHFGFEEDYSGYIYKAYFEYQELYNNQLEELREQNKTMLLCLALKWDPSGNGRQVKTKYTFYPSLNTNQIIDRITNIYKDSFCTAPIKYINDIINLAPNNINPDDIMYLEVEEENNPRKSYDINLYNADIYMENIYPSLVGLTQHYNTPLEQFLIHYKNIKASLFGHISGGIDREGRDFSTIYYGVEGYTK